MLGIAALLALAAPTPAPAPEVRAQDLYFEEHAANRRSLWSASPLLSLFPDFLRALRAEALPEVRLTAEDCVESLPCHSSLRHELGFAGERLVSVLAEFDGFHGGAHGLHGSTGRLWDRRLGRVIAFRDLFTSWEQARPLLQRKLCEDLRSRRPDNPEIECPSIDEVAIGLSDHTGIPTGGRADSFEVRTSDYQLGSYADGRETLWIEADAGVLALVKPEYRGEFRTYD